jgi:hypothetical protein
MNFTKREMSMIKLAAALTDPQQFALQKKAAAQAQLQDKLAAYGIGLTKKAEDEAAASKDDTPRDSKGRTVYGWGKEDQTPSYGPVVSGRRNTLMPQLGTIMPAGVKDKKLEELEYPYTFARVQAARNAGNKDAVSDARIFDNKVDQMMERDGGDRNYPTILGPMPTQNQVNIARDTQAFDFSKRIAGRNTNQQKDAERMLQQAGANNQESFETTGTIPKYEPGKVPAGYTGTNSLSPEQMEKIIKLFPAMGDTTTSRRFAGHA